MPVERGFSDGSCAAGADAAQAGFFAPAPSNGFFRAAPAALTTTDGVTYQPVTNADGSERELNVGTRERPNFLVLFATGIRNAVAANPNDANGREERSIRVL